MPQSKQIMSTEPQSNQLNERKRTTRDELTPRKPKSEKIPDDSSVVIQPLITKVGSISCSQKLRYHHPKNWQTFAKTGVFAFSDFGCRCYYSKCFNKVHEWLGWWCTSDVSSILYSLYEYVAYMLVNTLRRSSNLSKLRICCIAIQCLVCRGSLNRSIHMIKLSKGSNRILRLLDGRQVCNRRGHRLGCVVVSDVASFDATDFLK